MSAGKGGRLHPDLEAKITEMIDAMEADAGVPLGLLCPTCQRPVDTARQAYLAGPRFVKSLQDVFRCGLNAKVPPGEDFEDTFVRMLSHMAMIGDPGKFE